MQAFTDDRFVDHESANLHEERDAMVWAKEFCRLFEGKTVTLDDSNGVDPGLMVGWFANAMARGEWNSIETHRALRDAVAAISD